MEIKKLTRFSLIFSLYVVMTLILSPISYGVIQIRFSAGFYLLSMFDISYTIPLVLGTGFSNYLGGLGVLDIILGSTATLFACLGVYWLKRYKKLAPMAVPVFSTPIIAGYLHILFDIPFFITFFQIFVGQLIASYTFGLVVVKSYEILLRRTE